MSEIKYKKGDIVKEVWSDSEIYIFKVIKDISLDLWKSNKPIPLRYIDVKVTNLRLYNENECIEEGVKQYILRYVNTKLYEVLFGENRIVY